MPATGVVGTLLGKGWEAQSLAFFDSMPKREVRGLLPGLADRWKEEDYTELYREAKRQRRRLDLEDNVFLTHQRLLFRDKRYVDRQLAKTPQGEAQVTGDGPTVDAEGYVDYKVAEALRQGRWGQPEGEDRAGRT